MINWEDTAKKDKCIKERQINLFMCVYTDTEEVLRDSIHHDVFHT